MRLSFRIFCFILIPLICLPIALVHTNKPLLCLYMLVILAAFWSLDVLPYGITSLIPILFAPLMSIDTSQVISQAYSSDSLILCLGRLIMACAFQRHQIHRRFSLFLLSKFGPQPRMIMLSCMLPCYILTMFISNTATAPIMLEFVIEILQELQQIEDGEELEDPESSGFTKYGSCDKTPILSHHNYQDYSSLTMNSDYPSMTNVIERVKEISDRQLSQSLNKTGVRNEKFKRFSLALSLGTGYAASSGAVATLVASGPNLVSYGILVKNHEVGDLNYGTFMMVGLPMSIVTFLLTWLWVGIFNIGIKEFLAIRKNTPKEEVFKEKVKMSLEKLGKVTFSELSCIGLTLFVIIMWITRDIKGKGWGYAFPCNASDEKLNCKTQYVSDCTPMVLVVILLYIWPTRWDFWRKPDSDEPGCERLLTWEWTNKNLPWAIVFLLGIAFAATDICNQSGFSEVVAQFLSEKLKHVNDLVIVLIVSALSCVTTELLSSTTILPVYVSIFLRLVKPKRGKYLLYVFPLTFCSSYAFCLPAATTPNIAIFNRGLASTKDMIKTGIFMDILYIFVVWLFTYIIVYNYF